MQPLLRSLASWTAVIAPIVTLVGLIQSRGWLAGLGAVFACASVIAIAYARTQRVRLDAASMEVEGKSIDALNAANLRRRVNRSLVIQSVNEVVLFHSADIDMTWRYGGYCRAERETGFEFSVDSENGVPFTQLDCYGYDLKNDPDKQHKIKPVLLGPDGISKKIVLPFLEPLSAREPLDIMLKWHIPGCYKPGIAYYLSTLSFDQDTVGRCTTRLMFSKQKPDWVRVYECGAGGAPRLLRNLNPVHEDSKSAEYLDTADNRSAQSARIYIFRREIA